MGRIVAVDYGKKRSGIAVTDPMRLSINPKPVLATPDLFDALRELIDENDVDVLVLTRSQHKDGEDNTVQADIARFAERLQNKYPELKLDYQDEFGSSKQAQQLLIQQGVGKKKRRLKGALDPIAAGIILERYLLDAGIW